MDRALDLRRLTEALGDRQRDSPRALPSPPELQALLADAELRIFLRQTRIPDDLIRTGWYLHGVASASSAAELYSRVRQRRAFEISAHIFDLALNDEDRPRRERLSLAFGAEIGYRRAELDPNATAMFARVATLLIREPPVEAHVETLAAEAGVALLGFQTSTLFDLYRRWLRQLGAIQRLAGADDLSGTLFGPARSVVGGCNALLSFLAFGDADDIVRARAAFESVVLSEDAGGDLDARWVAAHLLDFTDDAERGSVWTLLPPDVPAVARQAFTLASPPVLTLWPPQRMLVATEDGPQPLSNAARRVVLSIPTSSGKTLLAQLMIVTHLARGGGGVCYVAPMRSLGREVRRALRNRLRVIARELGDELPDYGPLLDALGRLPPGHAALDQLPAEAEASLMQVLAGMIAGGRSADVEVMTPERLAHMLRRDPDGVLERFQMFVFDEAHFLSETGRGFTLESILAFLHWRTAETAHRIVLLSAALGNEGQIMAWLDPKGEGVALRSQWRGPRRLHAIFTTRPEWEEGVETRVRSEWPLRITYPLRGVIRVRPAEGAEPQTLSLAEPVGTLALRYDEQRRPRPRTATTTPKDGPPYSTQQYKMTARMVAALGSFGSVLVVTSTRQIAQDMARELADLSAEEPRALPVADMARQRLGAAHPLTSVLGRGVAFHHAALPVDVLEELEDALRDGSLRFMTCTSTLTEGVNLPVRTVVLAETQRQDVESLLAGARLVNAMGRAGRAGKESEGWIVLVRAAKERPDDFALMSPAREDLEITSWLATDAALEALAGLEERVRAGEDVAFLDAVNAATAFVSFVWFLLASEEERGLAPAEADLESALGSTLGFIQMDVSARARWRAVGERTRASYSSSSPERRRRWAHAGTSISTARRLDALAVSVGERIIAASATGDVVDALQEPSGALRILADAGVLDVLLALPENGRAWQFRETRGGSSAEVLVEPEALLMRWVSGAAIPDLAEEFLPAVSAQDWRVEQIVDAVTQQFEHFLAWTLGVVVELVNERLAVAGVESLLCVELPTYVRYGVNSEMAVRLLVSGVRSRRLAHVIAIEAAAENVEGDSLRSWLGRFQVVQLRDRFGASSSELLDLLEFARTPGASVLRDLLEQGRTELQVTLLDHGSIGDTRTPGAEDPFVADEPSAEESPPMSVTLGPVAGEERPPRIGIFNAADGELVAVVPTSAYGDVQSILDTGVPIAGSLARTTLSLVLVATTDA